MPWISGDPGSAQDSYSVLQAGEGFVGETWDRAVTNSSEQFTPGDGVVRATALPLLAGSRVTRLVCFISTAAAANTHGYLMLFSPAFALVAQSADTPASFQAANAFCILPMTAVYTVPATGVYYAAILVTAGAPQPTVGAAVPSTSNDPVSGGGWRGFRDDGHASPPNPAVPASAQGLPWFAAT